MKSFNFTIDSLFRHPLRWGICPIDVNKYWIFGITYSKENSFNSIKMKWFIIIYFYQWYYVISNCKIK